MSNNSIYLDEFDAPTLKPSFEEFKYLLSYIYSNEAYLMQYGGCKIIPPQPWLPISKTPSDIQIREILSQQVEQVHMQHKIYQITNTKLSLNKRKKTYKSYKTLAQGDKYRLSHTIENLEEYFWRTLNKRQPQPQYAADIDYSLFHNKEDIFNLNQIPLQSLLGESKQRFKGKVAPTLKIT
ncbi:unnamed protein product [Didymodactylos carnosus]|uniref:JmjN domain-containing protein n=1 Tax=Didymodactylos carnosus TaxID=1234261 RepID=A0A815I511_9BILA|nr:unnamed protein product [Didymodactylos carnosus]CAF4239777.1 unnamed protein product [Didymodactylos carnosus]